MFSWIDRDYKEQAEVPEAMRAEIRRLWLKGATPEQLSSVFKLPQDWVMDFALAPSVSTPIN